MIGGFLQITWESGLSRGNAVVWVAYKKPSLNARGIFHKAEILYIRVHNNNNNNNNKNNNNNPIWTTLPTTQGSRLQGSVLPRKSLYQNLTLNGSSINISQIRKERSDSRSCVSVAICTDTQWGTILNFS